MLDDLSTQYAGGGGVFLILNAWPQNPLNTVTINHVTGFPDPNSHMLQLGNPTTDPPMYGLVFTNNLMITGRYPVWNTGGATSCAVKDVPITSIANCFTTYTFSSNGLVATPSAFPPSTWPANNIFPPTVNDVGFTNFNSGNGGNYELQSSSPYKNVATDGKDLGAILSGSTQPWLTSNNVSIKAPLEEDSGYERWNSGRETPSPRPLAKTSAISFTTCTSYTTSSVCGNCSLWQ